jgi:hypothetical protein
MTTPVPTLPLPKRVFAPERPAGHERGPTGQRVYGCNLALFDAAFGGES